MKKNLCYLGETNCESNWMPSLLKSTSVDGFLQVQQYQDNCLQVRELIENKESKERSLGQTPFTILSPKNVHTSQILYFFHLNTKHFFCAEATI